MSNVYLFLNIFLTGLAVAADPNFKTFEAAYPFVVRKLLTDNTAATRRILHLVVLNRRKEFQWQKLALFLRTGATRKGLNRAVASTSDTSLDHSAKEGTGVFDVANLLLRFLPTKDGVVMRRLLMSAVILVTSVASGAHYCFFEWQVELDGAALIRAMVSKEAIVFRRQLCRVIADIIYRWMSEAFGQATTIAQYGTRVSLASGPSNQESPRLATPISDYRYIFRDRRLKVIFSKVLGSTRKDPVLLVRFFWVSFVMLVSASALAFHRMLVTLSEGYLSPAAPFASKRSYAYTR
ncbi:hypothetical protein RHGRI_007600 [Rhododendron griersonianum]|uniref:Uncharacterized protein n=1 Tax=Rhododendron griersonianum TaxID=479676 RepID=A0AAV6KY78_9ERIC|nr:hypothetical protein RHGRI_007600 [Rhododendron griersonianum]